MDSTSVIDKHADIVMDTTERTHDEWLEARRTGIGGSDAAAALGLSPYTSPYALWASKTGEYLNEADSEAMEAGRKLERAIAEWFGDREGIPVQRYPKMLRSKEHPFMTCNIDALGPDRPVEVKNVGHYAVHEWDHGQVPDHYSLQGQHTLAVTGLPAIDFAVLIGGQKLRSITIERNDSLIEALVEGEGNFWKLVEEGTPPAVDGSISTTKAIRSRFGGESDPESDIDLPMNVLEVLQHRAYAKDRLKDAQQEVDRCENIIKSMLGRAEYGKVNGRVVVTWRQTPGHWVERHWVNPGRRIWVPKQGGNT